jgi:hypothetical protein
MLNLKPFLLVLAIFMAIGTQAQDQEPIPSTRTLRKHELGLNVTGFAKQFLSFNNNINFEQSPYMLTYQYRLNEKRGLRFGLGGFYNSNTLDNRDVFVPRTNNDFLISLRAGMQFNKQISKRWQLHYGLDLFSRYARSVVITQPTSFGETFSKSLLYQGGLGPVMGFSFSIGEHVRIWTEANFYMYYQQLSETETFEGTSLEFTDYEYEFDASLQMPVSLFLSMTF